MPGWGDDINLVRYLKVMLSYILEQRAKVGFWQQPQQAWTAYATYLRWHIHDLHWLVVVQAHSCHCPTCYYQSIYQMVFV